MSLSSIEKIKESSKGLRGTLKESLTDEHTGAIRPPDEALIKFHGMYQQDDRDQRDERAQKKLEKLFSFMIRLRIPGGLLTSEQWVAAHHIAGKYSTGVLKITTRQTIQLHGILKRNIKPTLKDFDKIKLDSIAACGDVNRNVVCSAHPNLSSLHKKIHAYADTISTLCLPKTRAFYEVWLDEEKIGEQNEVDPLYQERYLPRKFKIGIAIPPHNDIDVFSQDVGLIAIIENNELKGFNIAAGGGLSSTHGNPNNYPRLATVLGFIDSEEKVLKAVYEIMTIQRDFGNRSDRKRARLKYTLDQMGVPAFKEELEKRCGFALQPERQYRFAKRNDDLGWQPDPEGRWHFALFVEHGRVTDADGVELKSALLAVAETGLCTFRFTCNQHIILSDISTENKNEVDEILKKFHLHKHNENASAVRKNSMACVALNTCPLALAEAQRYLPVFITKLEPILQKHGIEKDDISVRMTGCPNGCGRSPLAEIGLIGIGPGRYNLHLGGDALGLRLNKKHKENLNETEILNELDIQFAHYVRERKPGQHFGDFIWDNVRIGR
ncbi:MAG: NADPH-dependent assimilatory sulfite reductase hemoprotein subunit [Bacteroidetes bacterium]|nr:NADPH-dependent assimilatory sulfite reductase hemoprotein subunit [Bacteroidota bacterium]